MVLQKIIIACVVVLCVCMTTPSVVQAAGAASSQQAVSIAQQKYPGKVLSVKRKGGVYRVKMLNKDGVVRVIPVQAAGPRTTGPKIAGPRTAGPRNKKR